jgi:hypothetical protein
VHGNLSYLSITVSVAAGLYVVLVAMGVKMALQVDSKGWSVTARGCCVILAQAGALAAALIVLAHVTPRTYLEVINTYGLPFSWGLHLATAILLSSPLVTAVALWRVHKTRFDWMSNDGAARRLRRR